MALQLERVNAQTELNKIEANQLLLLKKAKDVGSNLEGIAISLALTLERKYILLNMQDQISNIASEVQHLIKDVAKVEVSDSYSDWALRLYPRFRNIRTRYDEMDTYDLPVDQVDNVHTKAVRKFDKLAEQESVIKDKIKKTLRKIDSLELRAKLENIPLVEAVKKSKLRISKTTGLKSTSRAGDALLKYIDTLYDIYEKITYNSPAINPELDQAICDLFNLQTEIISGEGNDKNAVDTNKRLEFSRVAALKGKYLAPKALPLVSNICKYCSPKKIKTFDYDPYEYEEMVFYPSFKDADGKEQQNVWVCRRCGRTERLAILMSWENIEKYNSENKTYNLAKKIVAYQPLFAGFMKWFRTLEEPKRIARIVRSKHKFSNSS